MLAEIEWLAQRIGIPGHAQRIRDIAQRMARRPPESVQRHAELVAGATANLLAAAQPGAKQDPAFDAALLHLRFALEPGATTVRTA